ncbi:acyltransferase family protein [Brachybacterium nesterenkovii]|uniref:Acyltransferase n=1 Tax=Brachybacterium nesterenkovii TaxID=47847 RepID=A0A1X6WU00_9MICO|nr:acyltransferase family protein [Brachybacterium nesterenkovii]SLM88494.1 hypothetical protein FM110_01875 [Brachybacterium nesterenkovii]
MVPAERSPRSGRGRRRGSARSPFAGLSAHGRPSGRCALTPSSDPSLSARRFRPELQGLRAVAILMVVCYHIWFDRVSGGVDIFLLISAFLLTDSFTRRLEADAPLEVVAYWGKAFKRLLAPAAIVIAGTMIAVALWYPPSRFADLVVQSLASATFWENWHLAFRGVDYYAADGDGVSPFQQFWSLSIQSQVFFLWPLLFALAALAHRRLRAPLRPTLLLVFGGIFTASLAWSVVSTASQQSFAYFDTRTRLWEFALGSLLALGLPLLESRMSSTDRPARVRAAAGWGGLVAILACGWIVDVQGAFPGWIALWPLGAAVVVIGAGDTRTRWGADRLLSSRPLRWVGDISYALYLVHWPILVTVALLVDDEHPDLVQGTAIVAASLLLGWLLTRFVDTPVRRWRWASARIWRAGAVITASLVLALAPAAVVQQHLQRDLPEAGQGPYIGAAAVGAETTPTPSRFQEDFVPSLDQLDEEWVWFDHPCDLGREILCDQLLPEGAAHEKTIVGYGNSHVQQFMGSLEPLARDRSWQLTRPTIGGCDYLLEQASQECVVWNEQMRELLVERPPDAVVLQATLIRREDGDREVPMPGYAEAGQFLLDHGIDVIAIRDAPRWPYQVPECVHANGEDSPACTMPRSEMYEATAPFAPLQQTTEARIFTIDPVDAFCPDGVCRPVIGNVLVFFDDNHPTRAFETTLAPEVERQLRDQGFSF